MMLHPPGIGVPDWPPPFRYALDSQTRCARVFEPFIAAGFSDAEAWESLFTDEQRLETFRTIHGNRKSARRPTRAPATESAPQMSLFTEETAA